MVQLSNDTSEADNKLHFYDLTTGEQYLIAVILTILFFMGIVGNSGILYVIRGFKPSHQYKPGRLLLIWMFGTDLALTIIMVLPATLTSFGWSGLPSESLPCTLFGYTETVFAALENLIILVMSLERSFTIYFPLRTILNVRRTNLSALVCILASILLATVNILISKFTYNPDALRCLADFYPEERKIQLFIAGSTMLFVFVPMLSTILVYVLIIRIVCKSNEFGHSRTSWQAIKTTLLVVGIYLLSALPFIVARLYVLATTSELPLRFRMFSTVIFMVNTAVNPYVYIVTNRSLRNHGKQTLAKSKHPSNVLEGSSLTIDGQSNKAWSLTRAIKNANTLTRQNGVPKSPTKNRVVLRSMTSTGSRTSSNVNSLISDIRTPSPRLDTIEDVLDGPSEMFHNDNAIDAIPTCGDQVEDRADSTEHCLAVPSTVVLVSDKH